MTAETTNTAPPIRIIELIGLPGTGKSTIARRLESILGTAGVTTRSRSIMLADDDPFIRRQQKRIRLIIRNAGNCGRLYRRSLRLIAHSGQRTSLR
jgi:uridine kinase